jgi:RHH-type rel operon transcriptional repressor/antitoxin RelB
MYTTQYNRAKSMSQSSTMTIRLDADLKTRLDKLADATHRSKSYLAAEAVREYIELNEWQLEEIQAAVTEADAGDFASEESVNAVFGKWGVNED